MNRAFSTGSFLRGDFCRGVFAVGRRESTGFSFCLCYNGHIITGEGCAIREHLQELTAAITPKALLVRLAETAAGFLFSHIVLSRGIMPFGIAYATAGSFFGWLGVFAGHFVLGRDVLRLLTSCFMARVFRTSLRSLSEMDRPLSYFLFTLWGTMLGGLVGFFFSDYTPAENVAFMFNGLLSGGFAWVFSVAASAFTSRPLGGSSLRYVCCLISLSALLAGLMGFGGLWETAGRMALLFLALCVGARCSFFYTVSSVMAVALVLFLFVPSRISFLLLLFFGILLSAALSPFGKYGQILSYGLSALGLWLFSEGSFPLWETLISVGVTGFFFLAVPNRLLTRLTYATVPVGGAVLRRRRARFRTGKQSGVLSLRRVDEVCGRCPKRWLCRTRDRAETEGALNSLRAGLRSGTVQAPREFADRCPRFPEIVSALRAEADAVVGLRYAKAFSQKDGELFCGDTAGGYRTSDDRFVFTLTDGMGSGVKASRQSGKAVRVMEHLARNGLSQEDIFKVLNRSLLDSGEEAVLGVDVACVDLKSGRCDLFKAGAAPTYVLRRGIAYEIGSETLPVGMLDEVDLRHDRCTLVPDDYLILVSDGILGQDKSWLAAYLNRLPPPKDCISLADGILREAKRAGRNRADDLTVLAVRVEPADKVA